MAVTANVARRLAWLEGKTCACGSADRLQVRYPPGTTTNIWRGSEARLALTLPLLGVDCWDCFYKAVCAGRGVQRATHGTRSMYRRGCRCQACHDAEVTFKRARDVPKTSRRRRETA